MYLKQVVPFVFVVISVQCATEKDYTDRINFGSYEGGHCITPNNRKGTCKKFNNCPIIFNAIQSRKYKEDPLLKEFISKSKCFERTIPYVCCEDDAVECTTVEQKVGSCVPLSRCDPITRYLSKKPFFNDPKVVYLQFSSSCTYNESDGNSRVCCPLVHTNLTDISGLSPSEQVTQESRFPNVSKETTTENMEKLEELTPDKLLNEYFPNKTKETKLSNKNNDDSADLVTVYPTENKLPTPGEELGYCGYQGLSDRILGGKEAGIYDYPWMALLKYGGTGVEQEQQEQQEKQEQQHFRCGGSLINQRYILTAAHCVVSDSIERYGNITLVRLGEWDTSTDEDCVSETVGVTECTDPVVDIEPEEIVIHPEFTLQSLQHDVALIRLSQLVEYTDFVKPICLPVDFEDRPVSEKFVVAGWGRTANTTSSNKKLYVEQLPLYDKQMCMDLFKSKKTIGPGQICVGGLDGKDSCTGDSGGPLMYRKGIKKVGSFYFQAGIVSFGSFPCAQKDIPAVYTNVEYYVNWIINNIKS